MGVGVLVMSEIMALLAGARNTNDTALAMLVLQHIRTIVQDVSGMPANDMTNFDLLRDPTKQVYRFTIRFPNDHYIFREIGDHELAGGSMDQLVLLEALTRSMTQDWIHTL